MTKEELNEALENAKTVEAFHAVVMQDRREKIAKPGEQLELFPTVWNRTERQAEAAADVLRWVETYNVYVPKGCAALMERARRYADVHARRLDAIQKRAKLTEQERADILADYTAAAQGVTHYTAAPSLMAKAVRGLSPRACFAEDRYLFYNMVFEGYRDRVETLTRYTETLDAGVEAKDWFVTPFIKQPQADAAAWGISYGFIDSAEFADVEAWENEHSSGDPIIFGGRARVCGDWERYYRFVWFAKNALMATEAELESVTKPPFPVEVRDRELFELLFITDELARYDDADALAAATLADDGVTGAISRPLAVFGAGGMVEYKLNASGIIGNSLLSLLRVKQERGELPALMYTTVEQVMKGVQLYLFADRFKLEKGEKADTLVYNTTFTDFARQCGYGDRESNQRNREQLRAAMSLLNAVQLSPRVYERSPVVFVYRQDKSRDDFLEIRVLPEYIQGKNRVLVNNAQAGKLKALGGRKGVELRFYNLTLTRGHKREEDILKQIYNHDAELNEAKRLDAEAKRAGQEARNVRKFNDNWSKHLKGRREKLARFFAEARACGALYWFEYRDGKDGAVYEWDNKRKIEENRKPTEAEQDGRK